jgi:quercetin dioxygenase-like cupin family protein
MYTAQLKDIVKKELPGRNVYVLTEKLPVEKLTVGVCEVPPKSTMIPHKHSQEEIIYIFRGHGHVIVDGTMEVVFPGTLVHFPSNKEHCTSNESNETMQFVFCFSPTVVVGSYG